MRNHWAEIEKYLEDQKIAQELIGELRDYRMFWVEDEEDRNLKTLDYGKR